MSTRVDVSSEVLQWALDRAPEADKIAERYPVEEWISGEKKPTIKQLHDLADRTRTAYGYFFLPAPPQLELPIADFRDGFTSGRDRNPSVDLLAVVHQSLRRQVWYRDYALENGLARVDVVGRAASMSAREAAADMRRELRYEVNQRRGSWRDQRKVLVDAFEALGGLTVVTSIVGNSTRRPLNPDEFRGFSLVDDIAPLVFINSHQTLNGQLFTLGHEFAHIWRGVGGVGNESLGRDPRHEVERWANDVASFFLVPAEDLVNRHGEYAHLNLTGQLEALARHYRCGTLVVLHALRRDAVYDFDDFGAAYRAERDRLRRRESTRPKSGGQFMQTQPLRIGRRLAHALLSDTRSGRTRFTDAARLMSFTSMKNFDSFAAYLQKSGE